MNQDNQPQQRSLLDMKSGGWVLVLAAVLAGSYFTVFLYNALVAQQEGRIGGSTVESYQFDLSNLIVPQEKITPTQVIKDGIPAITDPEWMTPDEVNELNEEERGKYLVSKDEVIGVEIHGETRAYPLRVLNWHEVVNDTLGGVPIAITHNPLSGSIVVFKREIDGEVLEFRHSGLLYNSHHLLFNKQEEPAQESLWCPLMRKAISGSQVNTELETLPIQRTHWDVLTQNTDSLTVIKPLPEYKKRYQKDPYGNYFNSPVLQFPVDPLPEETGRNFKANMVILDLDGTMHPFSYDEILENTESNRIWDTLIDDEPVRFVYRDNPDVVEVQWIEEPEKVGVFYSFWFAWYSIVDRTL